MTKEQRKKDLRNKCYAVAGTMVIVAGFLGAMCTQSETYAVNTNGNSMHYKYVTEYKIGATYIGKSTFLDTNGNEWTVTNTDYKKGKQYILTMHDNATENNIKDDVIVNIR